jgi:NADH-quinone oxidoreductase subunit H
MFGSQWGPYVFKFQSYDLGIGILFILAISSLGAYALLLAGWGSNNKYSLFGALRASAQMISYELAMGLSLVGMLMLYQSMSFSHMIELQKGPLHFMFFGKEVLIPFLPNWGIFYQPLGFLLFATAAFAETNRLPFDLPEAEGELVAGYHTEYGGLKMLMFYIGEYGHMMVASAIMTTFYFGGYELPFNLSASLNSAIKGAISSPNLGSVVASLVMHVVFLIKVLLFLWVFIWVRWTLPRFRYDQLMDLGWKTMLPWALANVLITAFFVLMAGSVVS